MLCMQAPPLHQVRVCHLEVPPLQLSYRSWCHHHPPQQQQQQQLLECRLSLLQQQLLLRDMQPMDTCSWVTSSQQQLQAPPWAPQPMPLP
jgi:hypothetical protein